MRTAERQRLMLDVGADDGEDRAERRDRQVRTHHDHAVGADSATGLSASTSADAAPLAAVLITMSVVPIFPGCRTPARRPPETQRCDTSPHRRLDSPKAIADGEWLFATAMTSNRARKISPCR